VKIVGTAAVAIAFEADRIFNALISRTTLDRHEEIAKYEPRLQLELMQRFKEFDAVREAAMPTKEAAASLVVPTTTAPPPMTVTVLDGTFVSLLETTEENDRDRMILVGGLSGLLFVFLVVIIVAVRYARRNHEVHRPDYEVDEHGKAMFTRDLPMSPTYAPNNADPEWDGMDLNSPFPYSEVQDQVEVEEPGQDHKQKEAQAQRKPRTNGWGGLGLFKAAFGGAKRSRSKPRIEGLQDPPSFPLPAAGRGLPNRRGMAGFGFGPADIDPDISYGGLIGRGDELSSPNPISPRESNMTPYSELLGTGVVGGAGRPFSPLVYRPMGNAGAPVPAYSSIEDRQFDVAGLYSKPRPNDKGLAAGLRSLPPLPTAVRNGTLAASPANRYNAAAAHDGFEVSDSIDENHYNVAASDNDENLYNVGGVGGLGVTSPTNNLRKKKGNHANANAVENDDDDENLYNVGGVGGFGVTSPTNNLRKKKGNHGDDDDENLYNVAGVGGLGVTSPTNNLRTKKGNHDDDDDENLYNVGGVGGLGVTSPTNNLRTKKGNDANANANGDADDDENLYNVGGVGGLAVTSPTNFRSKEAVYSTSQQGNLVDPFYDTGVLAANKAVASALKTTTWRRSRYDGNDSESYATGNDSESYATAPEETYASGTYPKSETYASAPATYASAPSEVSSGIYASVADVHMDVSSADKISSAIDGTTVALQVKHPTPVYSQRPSLVPTYSVAVAADENEAFSPANVDGDEEILEDRELVIKAKEVPVDPQVALLSDMRSEFANELDNISTDGISLDGILIGAMDDHINNEFSMFHNGEEEEAVDDDDDESLYADCNAVGDIPGSPNADADAVEDADEEDLYADCNAVTDIITTWPTEENDDSDDDTVDRSGLFRRRTTAMEGNEGLVVEDTIAEDDEPIYGN